MNFPWYFKSTGDASGPARLRIQALFSPGAENLFHYISPKIISTYGNAEDLDMVALLSNTPNTVVLNLFSVMHPPFKYYTL